MEDKKFEKNKPKQDSFRNKVGEGLEKAGHKISEAGMPKVGQAIHDIGDDVEETHSNPSHPHKTK